MITAAAAPRLQIVCPACQAGMIHRVVVLHAGEDTLITCSGAWESLPSWLQESFGQVRKGQPVSKRREVVEEIRSHLESLPLPAVRAREP